MAPRGIPNKPKTTETVEVPDLDDLLEPDEPENEDASEPDVEESDEEELDEEDAEIARLEAELKAPAPAKKKPARPTPEAKLTPKQKKLRDLQDKLAAKKLAELERDDEGEFEKPTGDDVVTLHFVADGFIAQGRQWFRGQTISFDRDGLAYEQTKDRNGNSWVDLVDDPDAQYDRYGKEFFRPGPWRGKRYVDSPIPDDIKDPAEAAAYRDQLRRADEAEAARGYAAPILNEI